MPISNSRANRNQAKSPAAPQLNKDTHHKTGCVTGNARPQDRPQQGNFNSEQMRARMTNRMREHFDIKDDAEWKAISERIDKVMEPRRNADGGGAAALVSLAAELARAVKVVPVAKAVQADLLRKTVKAGLMVLVRRLVTLRARPASL